ncbi:MAG: hypothetical protein AAF126_00685 [Chloroflexota bacterium]
MAIKKVSTDDISIIRRELEWQNRLFAWVRRYRLLILAVIGTIVFHAGLLFNGTLWGTYDAFVHMFFADHYARGWFDLWEERWYTGFTMVSYPPLTHQITALLSFVSSIKTGYTLSILASTVLTTIGVYRFSRLWVDHRPASYAALLAVFSSSIAETVHVFGQSPTMFVIGVLLNSLPFIWWYVEDGDVKNLFRAWAILMVAVAGHHVTTIFGMVFFCGPILATILWRNFRQPLANESDNPLQKWHLGHLPKAIYRRWKRIAPAFIRCGIFGVGFIIIGIGTVLPYWLWSASDPISQVTIPHGSRLNFLVERDIGFIFFVVPWGVLITILPYGFYKGFTSRNWILAASLVMLSLLGTGGTTPIPALLLQGAFYILTLDRFTFWGTIVLLPFAGLFVESLLHGRLGKWIVAYFGAFWRVALIVSLGSAMMIFAIFVANLTQFRRFQPEPIDMLPIVDFLEKDNHDAWRYMTLGFGDQLAWLSAQTTALNVEGNYHSARRLPEMTSTPIERMDGAKFQALPGLGTLHQILSNPQRYNLKYIFSNDAFYDPVLHFYGWHRLGALDNGIMVWERADVPPLPAAIPQVDYPDWQRLMWGILPVGSLFITAFMFVFTAFVPIRPSRWLILRWFVKRGWLTDWLVNQPRDASYTPNNNWQFWRKYTDKVQIKLELNTRRKLYSGLLGLLVIGAIAGAGLSYRNYVTAPKTIVLNYYDDVDFKRFADSYQWLETDLTPDEYLRYLSLRGGIVASFAKLENLYFSDAEAIDDDRLRMTLTLDWLTSLGSYEQVVTHDLVNTENGWRIVLDVEPPPPPTETFLTTTSTDFFIDLPVPSLAEGALNRGTLDRSLLAVDNIATVYVPDVPVGFVPEAFELDRFEGRWEGLISAIGTVQNLDVYPAHVTITALFRDADGNRIGESNAAADFVHQLLPNETTTFRVDLFGADATSLLDIDDLDSIELVVRGTPTCYNLDRSLLLLDEDTLFNAGASLVDIPRVLHSYTDAERNLLWTESIFVEQAIAPNDTLDFALPALPEGITVLDITMTVSGPRLAEDVAVPVPQAVVTGFTR